MLVLQALGGIEDIKCTKNAERLRFRPDEAESGAAEEQKSCLVCRDERKQESFGAEIVRTKRNKSTKRLATLICLE
jgi:hypothetical protein